MRDAVIIDAVRTASGRGKPGGAFSRLHPAELFAVVLRELILRNDIDPITVDDVIGGCVSTVGQQAHNITRTALLAAGFPETVPGTTVDRQCGSSQQAVHFAAQGVIAGAYDIVIAGGVESMSRVRMGSAAMEEDTFGPTVRSRYDDRLVPQGISAELVAAQWKLTRDELDAYAARSHALASHASKAGLFADEIVPVNLGGADGNVIPFLEDETIRPATTTEKLASLQPSFATPETRAQFPEISWSTTAGNSSPFTDAASAVLIMGADVASRLGLKPRAILRHFAVVGDDPVMMLTAPIPATRRILQRSGLTLDDIDAYEVNEAFASVPLAWQRELGADDSRLNPRGGAIALGHALGASGTRILTTLLNHLEHSGGRYGLQTMCEGAGMANVMIIERV